VELLGATDPAVRIAALKWVGRLEIGSAAQEVARFLQHDNVEVRIAAIEALVAMRATGAANGLIALLQHARRDLRITAVRALGELGQTTATAAVEQTITSKRFRDVERAEKVAFFEAFGRLAGEAGIPLLDRILNSKGWLGRGEPPEMRAGAALGLAKIRHPTARQALITASTVSDPVVRTAVARALQGEAR
jgi:HEAT repeat protein